MQATLQNRMIFCHDNYHVLQGINTNSIDLIYLDPPFNKKKDFIAPIGSSAEGAEFSDIFRQEDIKEEWLKEIEEEYYTIHKFLTAVREIEGRTSYNFCYLAYMAIRLMECCRILKQTGSLYLHCDLTMSHYLKILLDCLLGERNFRNEIIWYYPNKLPDKRKKLFTRSSDTILFYTKNSDFYFQIQEEERDQPVKDRRIKKVEGKKVTVRGEDGKPIYDIYTHRTVDNIWSIPMLTGRNKERTGYPTQKPRKLLERITSASCPEKGWVLDPFCGCATTCVAAEKLKRRWIGIDTSVKAYEEVKKRLAKEIEEKDKIPLLYESLVCFQTTPPQRTDIGKDKKRRKYIYIISHQKYLNEYKVGIASDVKSRLSSYQTADPDRSYKIEYSCHTSFYREIEKLIHEKYENKHEWVTGNLKDIIDDIENYKN